jgi:hypothetical protein
VGGCPPSLDIKVGDLLIFGATGGHIRSGADIVQFLGPFLPSTIQKDGKVISPMGTPNTVMFLARGPGTATIDVVTGDPWGKSEIVLLSIVIEL